MTEEDNKDVEKQVDAELTGDSSASAPAPIEASAAEVESAEAETTQPGAAEAVPIAAATEVAAPESVSGDSESTDSDPDSTIESLMQEAAGDPALENRAMAAAAEAAIREGERALESAARAVAHVSGKMSRPPAAPEKKLTGKRLMVLRGLLLFNVVMMGVMMVLPDPPAKTDSSTGTSPKTDVPVAVAPENGVPITDSVLQPDPNRYVSPMRHPDVAPDDKLVIEAFEVARKGQYNEAVEKLQTYLAKYPEMNPELRSVTYSSLIYYLRRDGRKDEALRLEIELRHLTGNSNFPADLLKRAHQAEAAQDFHEMRRAYAKLLLTQNTIGPAMRSAVTEAYLKFGNSYRHEAGFAGLEESERDRLRHEETMPSKAGRKASKKAENEILLGPSNKPPAPEKSGGH